MIRKRPYSLSLRTAGSFFRSLFYHRSFMNQEVIAFMNAHPEKLCSVPGQQGFLRIQRRDHRSLSLISFLSSKDLKRIRMENETGRPFLLPDTGLQTQMHF